SPVSMTVAAGGTYGNLPAPTRDGHTFNGWFTSATGGVQVDNDTGADTYGNVTLYAHWTAATYTVTFNANGGKVSPVSMTVAAGGTYGNLPAPTRDGHTFNGWFTSATGGVQVNNDTGADTYGNVTLYAHWTAKTIALEDLSYSFANSYKGLDYPNPYHIPYERYRAIFGDSLFGRMCYKMSGNGRWGGSCYGFSSTAAMFSQQGSGVTVDAFRSGASKPSQLRITDKHAQWNITAREFLEMMQISQNSPVIQADYQNNKNKLAELCAAVADFARTGTNPVIVAVFGKEGGHALLGYGLEKVSDTQSRLMVYDCNFPSQERYVTLTADSAGRYTGWSYRMNDTYNWGSAYKGSWISFVPYADFYKVWTGRGQQTQAAMEMLTVNANVVIKDFEGNAVASLDNGELITMRTDIFPVIQLGLTVDGENPPNDTVSVWIPVDIYDLERTDDYVRVNGEATLMDADSPFQATITHVNQSSDVSTTADGFTFVVDDGTQLNRVMFGENVTAGTYDITFHSTLDGKQEDVQITGTVMSHMMTFAMVNGEAVADAESMVSIQSYMLNGVRVGSGSIAGNAVPLVSFAANKGEGTMSPGKATEDGRFTFPVCEFTPPAGQSFTGWLVNGKVYQPGQSLTLDSDTTAVAQWSGSVPAIQNVTVSGGSIAVAATVPLDGLTVAVCAYAKSGQMLRCASGGSVGLSLDTAGAAYLRAFLLDAGTQRPVCEPYQKNL
ncbi:MAG: InlB B-repeat-containing protein, partial [Oscillibacter sp.]|nr:InlB B-repeat-containing protein [Oscillibacter sp.]